MSRVREPGGGVAVDAVVAAGAVGPDVCALKTAARLPCRVNLIEALLEAEELGKKGGINAVGLLDLGPHQKIVAEWSSREKASLVFSATERAGSTLSCSIFGPC